FNDTATTEIYTLSLHDALPISTSEPATSEVDYGLSKTYGLTSTSASLATDHKITLSSDFITADAEYHFSVKSADAAGNSASSPDAMFTTQGVSLPVKVVDNKGKALKGAEVSVAGRSATTNASGQAMLTGLPLGKQTAGVTYKGKTTLTSVEIKGVDNQ